MKKIALLVAAAVVMFAACAKVDPQSQCLSFVGTLEQPSDKTVLDGRVVKWVFGDEVKVVSASGYTGKFSADNSGVSTSFTHVSGYLSEINAGDVAVYPFDATTTYSSNTVNFKTTEFQDYAKGTFAPGTNVSLGIFTDSEHISFKNAFGYLKLSITCSSEYKKVSRIIITSKKDEYLAGTFSFDPSELTYTLEGTSKRLVLECGDTVVLGSTPTDFYIAVPAGKLANGFDVTIQPADWRYKDVTFGTSKTVDIKRSHLLPMEEKAIAFEAKEVPTSGIFSVSSTNKVRFAHGNFQAVYNKRRAVYRYQLADNQYDCMKETNPKSGNESIGTGQSDGAIVDLFVKSSGATNDWGAVKTTTSAVTFVDWAGSVNNVLGSTVYRTPTSTEIKWLLGIGDYYGSTIATFVPTPGTDCRTSSTVNGVENARWAEIQVADTLGMLIFPDTFAWTSAMGGAPASINVHTATAPTYTVAQFEAMENAGCIFLPRARYRYGLDVKGDEQAPNMFYYWNGDENKYYYFLEKQSTAARQKYLIKSLSEFSMGLAVRFVTDVTE